jgi:hypothetical protein
MARQRFQPAEHLAAIHRTSTDAVSRPWVDAILSVTRRSPYICSKIIEFIFYNSYWGVFNRYRCFEFLHQLPCAADQTVRRLSCL